MTHMQTFTHTGHCCHTSSLELWASIPHSCMSSHRQLPTTVCVCVYTMCVCIQCVYRVCAYHVYVCVSVYCVYILCVYTVCMYIPCVCILCVYIPCVYVYCVCVFVHAKICVQGVHKFCHTDPCVPIPALRSLAAPWPHKEVSLSSWPIRSPSSSFSRNVFLSQRLGLGTGLSLTDPPLGPSPHLLSPGVFSFDVPLPIESQSVPQMALCLVTKDTHCPDSYSPFPEALPVV